MTVVVGFNAGDFVLFGADGRETAPDGSFTDTKEKITATDDLMPSVDECRWRPAVRDCF